MANEGIEIEIYRYSSPNVLAGTLYGRRAPQFVRQVNASGAGNFTLSKNDPRYKQDPTLLDFRNIAKIKVDGVYQGAFVIKSYDSTYIGEGEKKDEAQVISGPGLKCWLDDAQVYPLSGIHPQSGDKRSFNFATERGSWYDASKWIAPKVIANYGPSVWSGKPTEWPANSGAKWIWGSSFTYPGSVPDYARTLFRYEFNIATAGNYRIYYAADDWVNVWVDGSQAVTTDKKAAVFDKPNKIDQFFEVGDHFLAFEVQNHPAGNPASGNPAGLLMAMYRVDDSANEIKFGQSDAGASWRSYYNPPTMPGWSPGEIFLKLFNEAVTRGVVSIQAYTPTFTATADSAGNPWTSIIDWSFDIGTTLGTVVSKMEEMGVYTVVDPTNYHLHMYQNRGEDRSVTVYDVDGVTILKSPIQLTIGRNLRSAKMKGQDHVANALMLKTADGWASASDTDSLNKYGRIESTLDASESTADFAAQLANVFFGQKAQPEEGATYEVFPVEHAWPLKDFFEGDWVLAPDRNGLLVPRHVLSIALGENESTGAVTYALEFDTIFQDTETRLSAMAKKAGGGGAAGGTMANTGSGNGSVNPPVVIGGPGAAPIVIPMFPTDLEATSVGKWRTDGITTYSEVTLTWAPVTKNTDNSDTVVESYEVQGWLTSQGVDGMVYFGKINDTTLILEASPNVEWNFQVRAINPNGQASVWSNPLTYTPVGPTTPMDPPTTPVLSSSLGLLTVVWDGKVKPSSPIAPPPQFRYTRIEVAPHGTTTWQQMGSVFQRGGGTASISNLTVGQQYDVRLIAIDGAGIASAPSGIASMTITGVDLGDLDESIQDAIDAANNAALAAASLSGLILDSSFEDVPLIRWTLLDPKATQVLTNIRTGAHAIKMTTGGSQYAAVRYNEPIPIDAGDSFLVRLWARCGVDGSFADQAVEVALMVGSTPVIADMTTVVSVATTGTDITSTYGKISGSFTVPAGFGYRYCVPVIIMRDTTSGNVYYVDDLMMFQQTDSTLIVDGAVIADKIAAEAITAGKIAAGAIAADNIQANAVTAEKMAADSVTANAIAAGSITGDKIVAGSIEVTNLSPSVGNDLDISANDTVTIIAGQAQNAQDSADSNADNLSLMQTYYAFGPDGAVISKPGSPFQVALRSDRIEMLENGNTVSYWTSGQLYVNDMVGTKVILGNHQIEKYQDGTVVRTL